MRNLKHSLKPSYWRLAESFNFVCWYEVGSEFLPKQWSPGKWSRKKQFQQFQLRMCQTLMVCKLQYGISNRCENKAFFNYFHSKVFFLILVNVCLTFRKYVTKIECLCKYSNHCSVFLNREYIFHSAQDIFRKYSKEYYTLY